MESIYAAGSGPRAVPATDQGRVPWFMTPYGRWRFDVEVAAMKERFPGFRLGLPSEGMIGWEGRLRGPFHSQEYQVQVRYPPSFPDEPPEVHIVKPELVPNTPHLILGNRPCLYMPAHGPSHGYDPGRTTAATLVAWTALWLHAYETWAVTGAWPGRSD